MTPRCSLFLVDGKSPYILSFICAASPTGFVLFFSSLIFEVQMLKWLPGNKQHRHFNMKLPASTAPPLCLFVCLGLVEWVAHCAHVGFLWRHLNERCLPLTPPQMLAGTHVALLWKRKLFGCVCVWRCESVGCVGGSILLQDLTSAGPGTMLQKRRSGKIAAGISPLFVSVDLLLNQSVLFNWKIQQDLC